MSEFDEKDDSPKPDPRLIQAYEEASRMGDEAFGVFCPEYVELKEGASRYTSETLLGEGSLKTVYKVYDGHSKRWVALARLRSKRGFRHFDDFIHEARLIASLNHPNIIKVHDIGVENDRPFFTMDLKGEHTLGKALKDNRYSRRELLDVFMKVCDAVAYAHGQGLIHLDLKPSNIQCDAYGEVLVCDWGLGRKLHSETFHQTVELSEDDTPNDSTFIDKIQGSLGYMAPEQTVLGGEKDERTDIYALGCILHTILTGKSPFSGTLEEILTKTRESEVEPPRAKFPKAKIPRSLNAIVLKALKNDSSQRYGSVKALQADIQSYLNGYVTHAENSNFFREARLFYRRNRLPVGISLAALILFTLGTALFLRNLERQRLETRTERQRAEGLLTAVDQISSEYDQLMINMETSREAVAENLAAAAKQLKDYGIYDLPLECIEQADGLTKIAFELDPDSPKVIWQRFSQLIIELNFKEALELPYEGISDYRFHRLAEMHPEFAFSSRNRPVAGDLIAVIRSDPNPVVSTMAHLERVLVYQTALQPKLKGLDRVLLAYIEQLNRVKEGAIEFSYDSNADSLEITSGQKLLLKGTQGKSEGFSGKCVLRLLDVKELSLSISPRFNLNQLEGLDMETLDLRGSQRVELEEYIELRQLETIHIRKGQIAPETLSRYIRSFSDFTIVEH